MRNISWAPGLDSLPHWNSRTPFHRKLALRCCLASRRLPSMIHLWCKNPPPTMLHPMSCILLPTIMSPTAPHGMPPRVAIVQGEGSMRDRVASHVSSLSSGRYRRRTSRAVPRLVARESALREVPSNGWLGGSMAVMILSVKNIRSEKKIFVTTTKCPRSLPMLFLKSPLWPGRSAHLSRSPPNKPATTRR